MEGRGKETEGWEMHGVERRPVESITPEGALKKSSILSLI